MDPLVGGRILAALSPKVTVTIAGDVGGWGAGSELDYQVAGLLGYRIKPSWTVQAGYRYLYVNYRSGIIFDVATSGVMFGVSLNLKCERSRLSESIPNIRLLFVRIMTGDEHRKSQQFVNRIFAIPWASPG